MDAHTGPVAAEVAVGGVKVWCYAKWCVSGGINE